VSEKVPTNQPPQAQTSPEEAVPSAPSRAELLGRIQKYREEGVSSERLAELLGAEEYLETIPPSSKGASETRRFNIQRFVADKTGSVEPARTPEQARATEIKTASLGWQKESYLEEVLGKGPSWMKTHLKPIIDEHPEWKKRALDTNNRVHWHYAPEIQQLLRAEKREKKEGWLRVSELMETLNRDEYWLRSRLETIIDTHPDWVDPETVGEYDTSTYDPRVLVELKRQNMSREAKAGWVTATELYGAVGKSRYWTDDRLSKIIEMHPHWREQALDSKKREYIFYSPEVVMLLKDIIKQLSVKVEGEQTFAQLEGSLEKQYRWLDRRLKIILAQHPEWVREAFNEKGMAVPHYRHEVFAELKRMKETGE
jgi:hypothetical protein